MFSKPTIWVCLLLIYISSGCSTYRASGLSPETRNLMAAIEETANSTSEEAPKEPTGEITLELALDLAFNRNASLAGSILEVRAADARSIQVGIYPNPELDIEIENIVGTGPFGGIDGSESTLSLSQPLLLGGKRAKRVEQANFNTDLAVWQAEKQRLDIYAEVHNAFNKLLISQEDITVKGEILQLSEKLLEITQQRIRAGKVSPAEASRIEVILAQNRIALEQARRLLEVSRRQLAATWGSNSADFSKAVGEYEDLFALPPEDSLHQRLINNPDLARYETEIKQRQATISLEDAKAIPDPTISGGVRHLNESGDVAFVLGVSIPLPISDRNQGGRKEARQNLLKAEKDREAAQLTLTTQLAETYNMFQAIRSEALALKEQIIPQAEIAYQRINEGYLQGRFDFLDVLDAQRTLFESKDRYLHALREFHETVVRIERLIAQKIH